jgi:hypothetical protein
MSSHDGGVTTVDRSLNGRAWDLFIDNHVRKTDGSAATGKE